MIRAAWCPALILQSAHIKDNLMSYKQVMQDNQTSAEFEVDGESYLLFSHPKDASTYTLSVVMPDNETIELRNLNAHAEQRLIVPQGTKFIIAGSAAGAKAWVKTIYREKAGQL